MKKLLVCILSYFFIFLKLIISNIEKQKVYVFVHKWIDMLKNTKYHKKYFSNYFLTILCSSIRVSTPLTRLPCLSYFSVSSDFVACHVCMLCLFYVFYLSYLLCMSCRFDLFSLSCLFSLYPLSQVFRLSFMSYLVYVSYVQHILSNLSVPFIPIAHIYSVFPAYSIILYVVTHLLLSKKLSIPRQPCTYCKKAVSWTYFKM